MAKAKSTQTSKSTTSKKEAPKAKSTTKPAQSKATKPATKSKSEAPSKSAKSENKSAPTRTSDKQHVVPHEDGWAVQKEGSDRATFVFETQREAILKAKELVDDNNNVIIHHNGEPVQ